MIRVILTLLFAGFVAKAAAGVPAPPPDETGSFAGTWYYVDPAYRIAIFAVEDPSGVVTLRYHVRDRKGANYETNAQGKANYVDEDKLVQVTFTAKVEGPNRITGRHERVVQDKGGGKLRESGAFEIYRAEFGRKLVMRYPEWNSQRIGKNGQVLSANLQRDIVRLFRRASTIVVSFDEIQF